MTCMRGLNASVLIATKKVARQRARWAMVCIIGLVGCVTASRERDGAPEAAIEPPRTLADAGTAGGPDANADAVETTGTFGHCCFEQKLFSCFCPTGVTCHFGVACDGGGCAEGDGSRCVPSVTDAAVE